ncbi:MAG: hypothetical protein AB1487_05470 [Thermodesulfobacteriota bacterium]
MTSQRLKDCCEAEFENIDTVISELSSILKAGESDYSVAELAAIATFIHNCYNGIENILKRILSFRRMAIKDTPTWHKDLVKQSLDIGVIPNDLYDTLINYLSFRHFFVHAYSFSLRWEDLNPLVEGLEKTLVDFKSAIHSYIDKLESEGVQGLRELKNQK